MDTTYDNLLKQNEIDAAGKRCIGILADLQAVNPNHVLISHLRDKISELRNRRRKLRHEHWKFVHMNHLHERCECSTGTGICVRCMSDEWFSAEGDRHVFRGF